MPSEMKGWHTGYELRMAVVFIQHVIVAVLYLIINCQVTSWGNWSYPYQSVFFPIHFTAILFDYVKARQWHYGHGKPILTSQQLWTDQILSVMMVLVDIVLLVNQAVSLKHQNTGAGAVQIALVSYVLVVSLCRWILCWFRKRVNVKMSASSSSNSERARLVNRSE